MILPDKAHWVYRYCRYMVRTERRFPSWEEALKSYNDHLPKDEVSITGFGLPPKKAA